MSFRCENSASPTVVTIRKTARGQTFQLDRHIVHSACTADPGYPPLAVMSFIAFVSLPPAAASQLSSSASYYVTSEQAHVACSSSCMQGKARCATLEGPQLPRPFRTLSDYLPAVAAHLERRINAMEGLLADSGREVAAVNTSSDADAVSYTHLTLPTICSV